ncbi:G2/mitotic-specific cyclin-B3 isoform X2 [Hylobates moloch]|uniref:G2/mitotic-specific cyclin-B3 isoform X2 n=1 Tax=Hylobates moloch TaxID=81572 RepID=UPI0013F1E018|nr:G2/mitotic-specific cyclin-B3 isoform X2 [Hylobates moloch]
MLLPLPPQSSKPVPKKSQSSKIVPSHHDPSEKTGENCQTKISPSSLQESPSSLQGALKKRSAFEDLTNASQCQPVQPKKEANKEFVKDVSKKINRNTCALGLAKKNKRNLKWHKLEVTPVVASTTVVPNIMEKPLILDISTTSKTPNTEEASLFRKPLVLKEEPTIEDKTLIKKSLSLKKCSNHGEVSLLEKLQPLQEESDSDDEFVIEPMTFKKTHKTEEAAITKKTLSLKKKMCASQGKQSCQKESLAVQDVNIEEDSFFMESMSFKEKPKTEESIPTHKRSSLKKKCTIYGKICHFKKPPVLQTTISGAMSSIKKPLSFKKKPTTEKETLFQELSVLQEKRTTEHEMSVLKKSLALQKTNFKEDSLVKESLAFKKKPSTEEAIMMPLILKEQCMTEGNMSRLKPLVMQEITSGEKSLIMKPLSIKEKPSTEKESFSQEPSALQEKHTTQEEVSILKEPLSLLKSPTEESLFDEALAFTKKCTIEEAPPTKKPLILKRKHATQGTMSHLKKPLVLQTTSGEKSLIKEPLPFKEEKVSLKKKCTTQEMMSICPELLDFQDMIGEDTNSFFMEPMSFRKNPTTEETVLTKTSLSLRKKKITQGKMSHLKKPLVLQETTSEEESFCKKLLPFKMKSTTEEKFLFQEPSTLKEKHTTLQEVSLSKESLAIQEKATTEEEFSQELFSLHVKHTNKSGSLFQEALVLKEKTDTEEDSLKKLLALQEKSTMEEESLIKKLLVLKRELSAEAATNIQRQLSLKEQSTAWGKVFLLKKQLALNETINEEQFLNKQPLALEGYPSVEEGETLFKKLLAMQEEPSIEKEAVFKEPTIDTEAHFKEPLALQEESSTEKEAVLKDPTVDTEAHFKETLALQEKPSIEQEALFKQHSALWEKPSTEKETIFKESLDVQEKPSIKKETLLKKPLGLKMSTINEAFLFEDMIALNEKPTNGKELSFKEPLALQESPTYKEDTFLKTFLVPQVGTSPNVSSTAPESITGKSSIATMTSVGKSGTISEAFLFEDMTTLNEKPTTGKELSFKEPLALQESPTCKEDTFLETFLIPQIGTSPSVFSTTPESITGKSSIATMTSVGKSSTTTESRECESASDKPFSPQAKGKSKEITPWEDIDEDSSDPSFNPMYAKEIFSYMKEREEQFILTNYMNRQIEITSDMRAILVDWLVEVQVSFEMTHETLYLAVKLVDLYLMKAVCKKDKLQLLGATAFMIAAKFEEHNPPCVDDFVYICDDNYQRYEVLNMEIDILNVVKFDINIPVAYHFLRRYARCIHTNMKTLTLSRYICEMTLQEYSYVQEKASKLAAASLLLALYMKKLGYWVPFLEYYSGYSISELHPLVRQLNKLLTFSSYDSLKAVYYKYSHPVFFEVAKIPALDMLKLEEILNCDCEAEGLVL